MDSEKALELARVAYPNNEKLRVAYMLGLNKGDEVCKEQLFKDAVEGIACIGYPFLSSNPFVDIQESKDKWCKLMRKFMNGDKVRIIVLEEEED